MARDELTAETVTDEEIREFAQAVQAEGASGEHAYCVPSIETLAQMALGRSEFRRASRARCAALINARRKGPDQ